MNVAEVLPPVPDAASDLNSDPVAVVHYFVRDLCACYERLSGSRRTACIEPAALAEALAALQLAESALRLARPAARPPQLVVIGPTQVGKSTVVNLLVGRPVAEVSPLAGFTVHPQAFAVSHDDADTAWLAELFPGWRRRCPGELRRDELDTFAYCPVGGSPPGFPACVIWDTPDFDSLSAGKYQRGVLEAAALADAYLLVLSKEKYSDLSAWKMLRLLEPLRRPLVICLNKLTPDAAEIVMDSLRQRLAEFARAWGDVPIVPLEHCPRFGCSTPVAADVSSAVDTIPQVVALIQTVADRLALCGTGVSPVPGSRKLHPGVRALVRQHWDAWTAPVRSEHGAVDEWQRQIEAGLQEFLQRYRRDYLDHPHRYDAFRRAALELLHLLEIPKLGGWITKTRQVVTWPVRQLWAVSRAWHDARRRGGAAALHLSAEAAVLVDALEALLITLQRDTIRRCDPTGPGFAVWQALTRRLGCDEARLRETFQGALTAHHAAVTRQIQAAANGLYEQLKRQPLRLAALRTARATIDVGALLLAVKTGGLSVADAIWAPASFALSSLLMEGIAGAQMAATAHGLKQRQFEAVQKTLVEQVLSRELRALAENLPDEGLYGISLEQLRAAERALQAWEQRGDG